MPEQFSLPTNETPNEPRKNSAPTRKSKKETKSVRDKIEVYEEIHDEIFSLFESLGYSAPDDFFLSNPDLTKDYIILYLKDAPITHRKMVNSDENGVRYRKDDPRMLKLDKEREEMWSKIKPALYDAFNRKVTFSELGNRVVPSQFQLWLNNEYDLRAGQPAKVNPRTIQRMRAAKERRAEHLEAIRRKRAE